MNSYLDINDARHQEIAAEILRRHVNAEHETNITTAIRDFLISTQLAQSQEIQEENPPSDSSRRAVDLKALDTFIEIKKRVSTSQGLTPYPDYVRQLDEYLEESQKVGKGVRMGILTDGRHWLLRWPGAGPVKTAPPYSFSLHRSEHWLLLYEWLRDFALVALENVVPDRQHIRQHFGPHSPRYEQDVAVLASLYEEARVKPTVLVKRQLWHDLLRTALGEVAHSPKELDSLFIRHTYLSAVIGMVVQASFGIDIRQLAETNAADLLLGNRFRSDTGINGIVDSDFFAWPVEVGGESLLKVLARRIALFNWGQAPVDVAAILYETAIPPSERRQLGEYYTPSWLARAIVREWIHDPLRQKVLDPACGSGTFLAELIHYWLCKANEVAGRDDAESNLRQLRDSVIGIDVHPVAVHLARAAWVLAAQPLIEVAVEQGMDATLSVPVYLGDALQLRFRTGDLFAQKFITIQVERERDLKLTFPVSLVDRAEVFDTLMGDVASHIESGMDPLMALDDNEIINPEEREILTKTILAMQQLHTEGRNHIWAYYTRNLVRPVALSRVKVDAIVGNPPWLTYNSTYSDLRTELRNQSKGLYGIWTGGRYATHQDIAGLFFARCVDLYLKDGGHIGMVLPHSALQTGQYAKWRTGNWKAEREHGRRVLSVDFTAKPAWDLEQLTPNNFFPVPAAVVFARREGIGGTRELWEGW